MSTSAIQPTALDELRLRLHGGVSEPGDPGYADACTLFNAMIDRRPRLVAHCATPDDVIAALAFGREQGLDVAVRAGGHSVAGVCLVDDGLVLDVRPMDDIEVDPDRRVARVGAGATWAQVDRATERHGLATTGGRVSTTGVAGLALGGGSGWLERKHGLTCDNILAVELVTADGRLVRATEDEHPELLWASRGGGGNFGVVTAIELALHPVAEQVFGGLLLFDGARADEVMALWRDVMRDAPDDLSLAAGYITAPAEEDVPERLHGRLAVAIVGLHAGSLADGEAAFGPFRALGPDADFAGPTGYADFQCSIDDPPGYRNWWTSEHLEELPDEVIALLSRRAAEMVPGPAQLFCVAWGGEVARHGHDTSPLGGRTARYVIHPLFLWEDPAHDEQMIALGRQIRRDLRPYATGATYLNFNGDEGHDRVRAGFGPAYERLAEIKAAWDPENVFRANHNVRPREAA